MLDFYFQSIYTFLSKVACSWKDYTIYRITSQIQSWLFSHLWLADRRVRKPTGDESSAIIVQKLLSADQQPQPGIRQGQQEGR